MTEDERIRNLLDRSIRQNDRWAAHAQAIFNKWHKSSDSWADLARKMNSSWEAKAKMCLMEGFIMGIMTGVITTVCLMSILYVMVF